MPLSVLLVGLEAVGGGCTDSAGSGLPNVLLAETAVYARLASESSEKRKKGSIADLSYNACFVRGPCRVRSKCG